MPVASGALEVLDSDVFSGNLEDQRKIGAQEINALAVSPDMDARIVPLRNRAARRH